MRLPYAPTQPPVSDKAVEEIYAAIAARRAPRPLQALDLSLLHAPPIAMGWNHFLGAVRGETSLSVDIREVAICRVAVLNGAWYEWHHHAPILRDDGGLGEAALRTLLEEACLPATAAAGGPRSGKGLTDKHWAVLDYTDQMTRYVRVEDAVFARFKAHFSDQEVVEVTGTVAAYNCVSRFLVALDVGEGNKNELTMPVK